MRVSLKVKEVDARGSQKRRSLMESNKIKTLWYDLITNKSVELMVIIAYWKRNYFIRLNYNSILSNN